MRLNDRTTSTALAEKYDAIPYEAKSNALSHPDHMAVVATLFGLAPPNVVTCRVLEFGCNDGANLLPMAASLPDAQFVGCDLSPRAIAAARQAAAELAIANVIFVEGDLSELPEALGEFDYMIAHGVYSWVPARVRDTMFAFAGRRLRPNGVMFVSYNVYPGCHVRRAVWGGLRMPIDGADGVRARRPPARRTARPARSARTRAILRFRATAGIAKKPALPLRIDNGFPAGAGAYRIDGDCGIPRAVARGRRWQAAHRFGPAGRGDGRRGASAARAVRM